MILLLGATGFVGQAFAQALRRRKGTFIPLSRSALDYTRFEILFDYVRKLQPEFVINADETSPWPTHPLATPALAGGGRETFTHEQEPDGAEAERMEMLETNTLLPQTVAKVCSMTNIPWGHVSSGGIFCGARVQENGDVRLERDLGSPAVLRLFALHPERIRGFSELDEPNSSFKSPPCTFYHGTKALGEESIQDFPQHYTWRFCRPFSQRDQPGNFLSHLRDGCRTHDALNSFSQVDDCAGACVDLWENRAPFGTYNVANPGVVSTHQVIRMIQRILKPARQFELLVYEPNDAAAREPTHPDCILDPAKLLSAGAKLRAVEEALETALRKWERKPLGLRTFA